MTDQPYPVLVTHGGKFHCDEVFAYAVLRLALGVSRPGIDHTLIRTRQPDAIASGDVVFDVGGRFEPESDRFDHHQRGAPLRADQTPYSAAGLVWRKYGVRAIAALLSPEKPGSKPGSEPGSRDELATRIAEEIDESVVRRIDEIDNGVGPDGPLRRDTLGLATLIGDINPTWDDPAASGPDAGDAAFLDATALAAGVLRRRVDGLRARLAAEAEVLAAHRAAEDPRLLVLTRGMPWKSVVHHQRLPVLLAVSPASNGNWMLDTVPPEPGSFAQKLPLPATWAGLPEEELARVTGVPDAVFVHLRRFVAAARTRDGAIALAKLALQA